MPLTAVEPKRLYRQIADQIAQLIASGEFPAGARLPAERELAVSLLAGRVEEMYAVSLDYGAANELFSER